MQAQDSGQVHLGQHVPVEDDDRFGQRVARIPHGAAGAEGRRFNYVPDLDANAGPVAEHVFDPPRLVVDTEDDLVDFGYLFQQIELVMEKRAVEDRHDRLRRVDRQRT